MLKRARHQSQQSHCLPPARAVVVSLALLTCATLLCDSARADEILLANGSRFSGRIIREDDREVVLRTTYGNMSFARQDIKEIWRDSNETNLREDFARHLRRDNFVAARAVATRIAQLHPPAERAGVEIQWLVTIARAELRAWRVRAAAETLRTAAALAKDDPEIAAGYAEVTARNEELERELLRARILLDRERAEFAPEAAVQQLLPLIDTDAELRREVRRTCATASALCAGLVLDTDLPAAIAMLERALEIAPDASDIVTQVYVVARAMAAHRAFRARRIAEAMDHAQQAVAVDPASREALFIRGELREVTGDASGALIDYLAVLGRDPRAADASNESIERCREQARALVSFSFSFDELLAEEREKAYAPDAELVEITRGDVTIHAPDREFAEQIHDVVREQRARLPALLGMNGDEIEFVVPLVITIHPAKTRFEVASPIVGPHTGITVFKVDSRYRLAAHEIHTFASAPSLRASVIPHEIAHVLARAHLGYKSEPPLWLHEGIAIQAEPHYQRNARMDEVRAAIRGGRATKLSRLFDTASYPSSVDDWELYYGECFALVTFLRAQMNDERFWKMADEAGADSLAAIGRALDKPITLAELESEFTQWMDR